MKLKYIKIFFLLLLLLLKTGKAQNFTESEAELAKKADRFFREEDFENALPIYSQLLSLHAKDPVLSYKFGVSLLMADRRDSRLPIKYLEWADSKEGVGDDLHYYLGIAYMLNYRFTEAEKEFNTYKSLARSGESRKYDIDRRIEMCRNGKQLLSNISDLYVLEKKVVGRKDFFRSYNFAEFGGKFLAKLDVFKTKLDIKMRDRSFVFYSEKNNVIYFSSYGEEKGRNPDRDIYRALRQPTGEWSRPQRLSNTINTKYDEDYPFLLPDGKTLYFCSKGHNSMGGYDIFKTSYDKSTQTWSEPENLDFAINTPFDDILFVSDSEQHYAYFSSTRNTSEGMYSVFKVRIDKRIKPPVEAGLTSPSAEMAFTSQDSAYLNHLREVANLNVNATEDMFEKATLKTRKGIIEASDEPPAELALQKQAEDTTVTETPLAIVNNKLRNDEEEEEKSRVNMEAAKKVSAERQQKAETLRQQADSLFTTAEKTEDIAKQKEDRYNAELLIKEAEKAVKESEIAGNMAKQYQQVYDFKRKEANRTAELAQMVRKTEEKGNIDSTIAIINEISKEDIDEPSVITESREDDVIAEKIQTEIKEVKDKQEKVQEEIDALRLESDDYKSQAKMTKDNNLKNLYNSESRSRDSLIDIRQREKEKLSIKYTKLNRRADSVIAKKEMMENVIAQINTAAEMSREPIAELKVKEEKEGALEANKSDEKSDESEQVRIKHETGEITENIKPDEKPSASVRNKPEVKLPLDESIIMKKPVVEETKEKETEAMQEKQQEIIENEKAEMKLEVRGSIEKANKDIIIVKQYADKALKSAVDAGNIAVKTQRKADSLFENAGRIKNKTYREVELKKAAKLQAESDRMKNKAIAAERISKKLEEKAEAKSQIVAQLNTSLKEINNIKDTEDLQVNKEKISSITEPAEKNFEISDIKPEQTIGNAEDKSKEAEAYAEKAVIKEKEIAELNARIEDIHNKAEKESNIAKKTRLAEQTEKLKDEVKVKENEVYKYNSEANKLIAETERINSLPLEQDSVLKVIAEVKDKYDTSLIKESEKKELNEQIAQFEKHDYSGLAINRIEVRKTATDKPEDNGEKGPAYKLVKQANERIEKIEDDIARYNYFADSLKDASLKKNMKAEIYGMEAAKLLKHAAKEKNDKPEIMAEVKRLRRDSAGLMDSSIVEKIISEQFATKAKEQQESVNNIIPDIELIDEYADNKEQKEAEKKSAEVIRALDNKMVSPEEYRIKVIADIPQLVNARTNESRNLLKEAKKMEDNLATLNEESNNLKKAIDKAKDDKLKQQYQQDYKQKKQEADTLVSELKEKYRQGNQLKIEASALKTQVEYAVNVVKNSNIPGKASAVSEQLAATEKKMAEMAEEYNKEMKEPVTEEKPAVINEAPKDTVSRIIIAQTETRKPRTAEVNEKELKNEITENEEPEPTKTSEKNEINYNEAAPVKSDTIKAKQEVTESDVKKTKQDTMIFKAEKQLLQKQDTVKALKKEAEISNEKENELPNAEPGGKLKNETVVEKPGVIKETAAMLKDSVAENKLKYQKIKQEVKQIAAGKDTNEIKDTNIRRYEYEADFYFRQALIAEKKADSSKTDRMKTKYMKDANAYEQIAVVKQQKALEAYRESENKRELIAENKQPDEKKIAAEPQENVDYKEKTGENKKEDVTKTENLKEEPAKITTNEKAKVEITEQINISEQRQRKPDAKAETSEEEKMTETEPIQKKAVSPKSIPVIIDSSRTMEIYESIVKKEKEKELTEVSDKKPIENKQQPQKVTQITESVSREQVSETGSAVIEPSEIKPEYEAEKKTEAVASENEPVRLILPEPEPMAGEIVTTIKGMFYTVQIGVFGKARTAKQLMNLNPVFYDIMSNGNYRYLSGVYDKKEDAIAAKNAIAEKGIKDAFIVVYVNGIRITNSEAQKMISEGRQTFAEAKPVKIGNDILIAAADELYFKVQIGAYRRETDLTLRNEFLRTSGIKISSFRTATGLIIYAAGEFKDYNKVVELRKEIVDSGIADAFIIAMNGSRKIPVPQARELLKK